MNESMHNMGGFRSVELVYIDEITNCYVTPSGVELASKVAYHEVKTAGNGIRISAPAKRDKKGIVYQHRCVLTLTPAYKNEYDDVASRGCVVVATDNNGKKWVYGCREYPLMGRVEQVVGNTARDLHKYVLTLEGASTYPEKALL